MNEVEELEAAVEIDAPAEAVWALVSDPRRMAEWSPQVTSTRLSGGAEDVALGTRFTNRNKLGELEWPTRAEVVVWEPPRAMAFRVDENWVVWSFEIEPVGPASCRLVQRRRAPEGVSDLSQGWAETYLGGHDVFTETMRADMRTTLEAIRAAATA